ncbi:MAG: hypothetical protein ACT4QE_04690, partial [Anaerolineales bacterium]
MKLHKLISTIALLGLLASACAPAATTPATEPTQAPAATVAPQATEAPKPTEAPAQTGGDKITLGLWTHSAGNPNELAVIETWVKSFNDQSDQYQV